MAGTSKKRSDTGWVAVAACPVDVLKRLWFLPEKRRQARGFLTSRELKTIFERKNAFERMGARIAAKRALFFLLRRFGFPHPLSWREMEVCHEPSGKPCVVFKNTFLNKYLRHHGIRVSISLTHCERMAMAAVWMRSLLPKVVS